MNVLEIGLLLFGGVAAVSLGIGIPVVCLAWVLKKLDME